MPLAKTYPKESSNGLLAAEKSAIQVSFLKNCCFFSKFVTIWDLVCTTSIWDSIVPGPEETAKATADKMTAATNLIVPRQEQIGGERFCVKLVFN